MSISLTAYSLCMKDKIDIPTEQERLQEVAEILAAGVIRYRERQKQSKSAPSRELPLDFMPTRSMCVTVTKTEKHHE